jgi:hypothetical protein
MEYTVGKEIEFNVYGSTIKGIIVKEEGDLVCFKTTQDFIKENIGEEQSINKTHRHVVNQ